jgi:hypothetical protein
MSDIKNFSSFLNENLDNKSFILERIKVINEKTLREVFAWYIENICEDENDIQLISTALKNKSE